MPIFVQMRGLLCGQRRIWCVCAVKRVEQKSACAPDARAVGKKTRAPVSKVREEKSGWISLQSLMNWLLCRSAEAGF
jgi:hypothetical protein